MQKRLFSSESVTEGHPDKMCDQISDAILDAIIAKDPDARVACETATTTGLVLVMGEISTDTYVDVEEIVREVVGSIGYTRAKFGFDASTCAVLNSLNSQSPDIALGVDQSLESKEGKIKDDYVTGAGDQGTMFGYACNETEVLMPLAIHLSHKLAQKLAEVRKSGEIDYLRPDGKTLVTVEYDGKNIKRVHTVVVSSQHAENVDNATIREDIINKVIKTTIPSKYLDDETKYLVNPTGRFVIGGPMGDSGLTGRKIIVDTYGGSASHGGGAFSGKDPTKVDRSAAYAARYIAKNIVAAKIADECQVMIAYAIGLAQPISITVDTCGTGKISDEEITNLIRQNFDLRPAAIIDLFKLKRPIYRQLSAYGHFGRDDLDLPWEKTDKVELLKSLVK